MFDILELQSKPFFRTRKAVQRILNSPAHPQPSSSTRGIAACALAFAAVLYGCSGGDRALSPEEAIEAFQIAAGFRAELFAAEPHVSDPVEMAFDENGGIYVAEMHDNPDDPPPGQPALSRVVYLEDTDGDGRIDKQTVFADDLLVVKGVLPWKGGLIVTAAPDILWLQDTDGDHRADVRKVLYTGFDTRANMEFRIGNPRLGVDNWLYVANFGMPGEITSPDHPGMDPVIVRGGDFRFHPLRGTAQAANGGSQFGLALNQWGDIFITDNTTHLRHTVIPPGYLARNRFLVADSTAQDISDHGQPAAPVFAISKPQQWRVERTQARQQRYDQTRPGRIEHLEGYFTASCGVTAYLGDNFPEEYAGNIFVADGNGNLVHRDVIRPSGSTYTASREPRNAEFLASTDNWFRPVNFANAPDGNLYVIDYDRQNLEHPEFIPEALRKRLNMDFERGNDLGRIYRIVPSSPKHQRGLRPKLGAASTEELVALMGHPNGWHRETSHRLLIERADPTAVPAIERLFRESTNPVTRIHALWSLEGLEALGEEHVRDALRDEHWAVRKHAVLLAERFLRALAPDIVRAASDEHPHVRMQALLTLGNLPPSRNVVRALARTVAAEPEDRWMRLAVLSASPDVAKTLAETLLRRHPGFFDAPSEGKQALISGLSQTIGARRRPAELSAWIQSVAANPRMRADAWQQAGLDGLAKGLALDSGERLRIASIEQPITQMLQQGSAGVQERAAAVTRFFVLPGLVARSLRQAADTSLPIEQRVLAVTTLRGGSFEQVRGVLESILTSPEARPVQQSAAESLASFDAPDTPLILLKGWSGYSAETRRWVTEDLLRHRERIGPLLDAVERGDVDPRGFDEVSRIRMTQFPAPEIAARATALFDVQQGDRQAVVEAHQDVLNLEGDPERGKQAFDRECSKCHLATGERARIGPDLSGVNNRNKDVLLNDILNPSSAIQGRYANYILETSEGRFYDGLIVSETTAAVTIRGETHDVTVLRGNIKELRTSSVSLMPEGLEESLSRQELADVVSYLRSGL
jgi:putative membrane-bound dehydrogenase-like protein